jgi:hypothetical protein
MVAQINATITSSIVYAYTDFDGTRVDIVETVYPDGSTEQRQMWTEDNLDGTEQTHFLNTQVGRIISSAWKTSKNNKWFSNYRQLWFQRWQAECTRFNQQFDTLAFPEQYSQEEYEQAKADLGFTW